MEHLLSENLAAQAQNEPPAPPPFTDAPIFDSDEAQKRLEAALSGEDAPAAAAPPPPTPATSAEDTAPAEEPISGDDQEPSEPAETPSIEPPRFWSKEAREHWQRIPPETQEYLRSRENERDVEVRRGQNEVAEKAKALEAERQAIANERQQWQTTLQPVLAAKIGELQNHPFAQLTPEQRVQLRQSDPARFVDLKDDFEYREREAARAFNAHQELVKSQAAERQAKSEAWAKEQYDLVAQKTPEFTDEKTGAAMRTKAEKYLQGYGFTPEEITALRDHRYFQILRDALKGREAGDKTAIAQAKVANAKPVARPGASKGPEGVSYQKRTALVSKLSQASSDAEQAAILAQFDL
jgi:hypothetical protein